MTLTRLDAEMLREVAAENVTFRDNGHGRSYRRWLDERNHVTETPRIKRLIKMGLVEIHHSHYSAALSGSVELAEKGRKYVRPESVDIEGGS